MLRTVSLLIALLAILVAPVHAQTDAQLRGGIVINEILADPGSDFDTDGNENAETGDEFVELFNVTETSIDIGGLQLWDDGRDKWYTIPEGQTLDGLSFAVVVAEVADGGSLPNVAVAFDAESGGGVINNSGDNVIIYDPDNNEYIQALNADDAHDPPAEYDGFSGDATRNGGIDDFGNITSGVSKVRVPSGHTSYEDHEEAVNGVNASPGEASEIALPVELTAFTVTADAGTAVLSWQTASETNNAGFAIEHRTGATETWTEIDFVDGAGTTAQQQSYQFTTDALRGGPHTFRLRQVDVNGATYLGPERTITMTPEAGLSLSGPHPLGKGQVSSVTVTVEVAQHMVVALYNVLGQRVQTVASRHVTPEQPVKAQVSTSELSSGIYFLRATGPSLKVTRRLVIAQ